MAVPPSTRPPLQARPSRSWSLDILLGLLIVISLPLAVVAVPNTLSVVAGLLPADLAGAGLMRTHGLALPALMPAVPLAAALTRRVPAAPLLVGALALVAVSDAAGGYAASELVVGVVRVLRGLGSGAVLAVTLIAVWDRAAVLRGLWAGMFALSLLTAQALALWPLDEVTSWRVTLQPYPMVTGIALGLAAVHLVVWMVAGRPAGESFERGELKRLLLLLGPVAVVAAAAVSTASAGWRSGAVVLIAALAVAGLLGLASVGGARRRVMAYAMVAVGVVLLPSAAQVTMAEMGGLGGPGLRGLWVPYTVAGVLAIAAAVAVRLLARGGGRWLAPLGLLAMVVGLCSVRLVVPSADGMVLTVPFTLLAVGAAVAITAGLQEVGIGAAAYGLTLCCTGVLAGFLLGAGVQMAMLEGVRSPQELVDGYMGALHWWALISGFLMVAIIALAALTARRGKDPAVPERPCAGPSGPTDVLLVSAPADDRPAAETQGGAEAVVRWGSLSQGGRPAPSVPPPGQSPEDAGPGSG
ncbi:hypothetical protein [Nonomuraea sp. NPDC049309]|uniref:hypothetical protein n=1 Tax=Nonomuraea sp. NPDC049309 TaxID=3364350 RepID=UPI00371E1D8C